MEGLTGGVRAVYDATAAAYVEAIGTTLNPDFEGPVDRALLAAFAELASLRTGPVADLGCGPGRVTSFLAGCGLTTIGLDLSPAMAGTAAGAHPHIPFGVADLQRLPIADGVLAGAVCWYSIIHTPAGDLATLLAEVVRALAVGSPLLVAFQTGDDEQVHREDAHGSGHPLISHRHHVDTVAQALVDVGVEVRSTTVRQPMPTGEPTPQAFVLASS